eukprot:556241-Pyramimonas_sp.AAC.1
MAKLPTIEWAGTEDETAAAKLDAKEMTPTHWRAPGRESVEAIGKALCLPKQLELPVGCDQ